MSELEQRIRYSHPEYEYTRDGRAPICELLSQYNKLRQGLFGEKWSWEGILYPTSSPPVPGFVSPHERGETKFLWIIGGIHGDEPAGPNAFAQEIETIAALPKKNIPVVFIPLVNTIGYPIDWHTPNKPRSTKKGKSIGDSRHLLIDKIRNRPRRRKARSELAMEFTRWVVTKNFLYPPFLVVDHHEDEIVCKDDAPTYGYILGEKTYFEQLTAIITDLMKKNNFPIWTEGISYGSEKILNGFVHNTEDDSTDELLCASRIWVKGKIMEKPSATITINIETTRAKTISLEKRTAVHREIIRMYPEFWRTINS